MDKQAYIWGDILDNECMVSINPVAGDNSLSEEFCFKRNRLTYKAGHDATHQDAYGPLRHYEIVMTPGSVSLEKTGGDKPEIMEQHEWTLDDNGRAVKYKRTLPPRDEQSSRRVLIAYNKASAKSFEKQSLPYQDILRQQFDFGVLASYAYSSLTVQKRFLHSPTQNQYFISKNQEKFMHFMHESDKLTLHEMYQRFVKLDVGKLMKVKPASW